MSQIFFILALIGAGAVAIVLFTGLFLMGKGGESNRKYSNQLMRARVYLQGATLLLLALALITAG